MVTGALETVKQENQQDKIFTILFEKDDVSWQDIIYDLIRQEQMDPWDVDISLLADKFIKLLAEMKKMDFRLSGKIIVAAAFFLKIKSDRFLNEDITALDSMMRPIENQEDLLDLLDDYSKKDGFNGEKPVLKFRTPQPRKRKVSVYDLVTALEKALEGEQRRNFNRIIPQTKVNIPKRDKDMTVIINDVYKKIQKTLQKVKMVKFSQLVNKESRDDKIFVFVPLLYLDTQRKIDIVQKEHFGDIDIHLAKLAKIYSE